MSKSRNRKTRAITAPGVIWGMALGGTMGSVNSGGHAVVGFLGSGVELHDNGLSFVLLGALVIGGFSIEVSQWFVLRKRIS